MPTQKKIKKVLKVGREEESGLSSFVERPVPNEGEVISFERVIGRELREQEIDSNLDEIYKDSEGDRVDVHKVKVKKRPIFLVRFFKIILTLTVIAILAYVSYFYLFSNSNDVSSLSFQITSPDKVVAGQEFSYKITYHNPTKYPFKKLHLELQYPENFVFDSASVAPTSGNSTWNLPDLTGGSTQTITVKGMLLVAPQSTNVIFGHLSYVPNGFSSQFKKDASFSTTVSSLGFTVNLDSSKTAFLNQNNDLTLVISNIQNNYIGDFNLTFSLPSHTSVSVVLNKSGSYAVGSPTSRVNASSSPAASNTSTSMTVAASGGTTWTVSNLYPPQGRQEIPLVYKVSQDISNPQITVQLSKRLDNGQSYVFWEKTINPQLVKSDLNLTLSLNGHKTDGAVNFGQTLNYQLSYSNNGSNTYNDVVLMAAIQGDFLDWSSVKAGDNGQIKNQTIVWTKSEDSDLATIKPGDSGVLNFSVKLTPFTIGGLSKGLTIVSYGQYGLNGQPITSDSNKSNTINDQINSDLALQEKILYFDSSNRPVGSGPLPPAVGQTTTFRVNWNVTNSLHELSDVRVIMDLPAYVSWAGNNTTNVGSLYFDSNTHQVIWAIGRLPVTAPQTEAFFDISITPQVGDRNKILILSPGSVISAMDTVTTAMINKKLSPQTTKLEDDNIAALNNSGVIQ